MSKISWAVVSAAIAVLVGAVAWLANWDIPPPTSRHEIVIPNDRFAK